MNSWPQGQPLFCFWGKCFIQRHCSASKRLEFHRLSLFQAALVFFFQGATSCSSVIWLKMASLNPCPLLVQHNYLNVLFQYSGWEDFEDICYIFSKKQKGNKNYYNNMSSKYIQGPKLRLPGRQCDQKFSSGDENFTVGRQLATRKAGCHCRLSRSEKMIKNWNLEAICQQVSYCSSCWYFFNLKVKRIFL